MRFQHTKQHSPWSASFILFTIGVLALSLLINTVRIAPANAVSGVPLQLTSGGAETSFLPTDFVEMNGLTYFLLNDASHGVALWKSDGTVSGTTLVKDITEYQSNVSLTLMGGLLYITGVVTGNKGDLWESDGTTAGTVLLKSGLSFAGNDRFKPVALNGALYFGVSDIATDTTELWTSDGTAVGTVKVLDIGVALGKMVVMGNNMYFPNPNNAPNQPGYWKSDGTVTGTSHILMEDLFPSMVDASTSLGSFTVVGDELFYWMSGDVSSALIKTTDTAQPITTIVKENINSSREPIVINGVLYFYGWMYETNPNVIADVGLWKSDGTTAGTVFIASSFYYTSPQEPRPTIGDISSFASYNGQLVIFSFKVDYDFDYGSPIGMEVWTSDGTTAGTTKIKEILSLSPSETGFRELGGLLYFTATTDDEGHELWESDGTTAGTAVIDLNPGTGHGYPGGLSIVGDKLFFWANDDTNGFRPWVLTNI